MPNNPLPSFICRVKNQQQLLSGTATGVDADLPWIMLMQGFNCYSSDYTRIQQLLAAQGYLVAIADEFHPVSSFAVPVLSGEYSGSLQYHLHDTSCIIMPAPLLTADPVCTRSRWHPLHPTRHVVVCAQMYHKHERGMVPAVLMLDLRGVTTEHAAHVDCKHM